MANVDVQTEVQTAVDHGARGCGHVPHRVPVSQLPLLPL